MRILYKVTGILLFILANNALCCAQRQLEAAPETEYAGKYFLNEKGYPCYVFQKHGDFYFNYANNKDNAHKLVKDEAFEANLVPYSCSWIDDRGNNTSIKLGFWKNGENTVLYIHNYYRGQLSEDKYFKETDIALPTVGLSNQQYMVFPIDVEGTCNWSDSKMVCEGLTAFGYDDWFLPNKDLLNELFTNKDAIGNFSTKDWSSQYWCTEEKGSSHANCLLFTDGTIITSSKITNHRVRCVRLIK